MVASAEPLAATDWTDFDHTGPGTLAGRYLRLFWQPVYRAKDLLVGRAAPISIMGQNFTLYRGESGAIHALDFRCAHRGTQLSTGWVEGDTIRCFYHGWRYDGSGQCVEQPAEPEPFCQKIRIRSYPTEEYLDLIFVYFGDGEPPALPRYPLLEQAGRRWTGMTEISYNFFIARDNDNVHPHFVHPQQNGSWREWNGRAPTVWADENDFGLVEYRQLPNRPGVTLYSIKGMPNIGFRADPTPNSPDGSIIPASLRWRVPIDDEHHWQVGVDVAPGTADGAERFERPPVGNQMSPFEVADLVLAGKLWVGDIGEYASGYNLVKVQDQIAMGGQGAIAHRENEHLGQEDAGVILLRLLWMREMRALAEGRPVKEWKPPLEMPEGVAAWGESTSMRGADRA